MTVKRRAVDESMFVDKTFKNIKVDLDRAGQMLADMAYHGSQYQDQQMMQQGYHPAQFAPPAGPVVQNDFMMVEDNMAAASVHNVPTHRFISSCVRY